MTGTSIEYFYGSSRMIGYFCAAESSQPLPGVVVVHDAFGLGDRMKQIIERVAALGYAALAADIWGDGAQLRDESMIRPTIGRFAEDRNEWMGRLKAAQSALQAQPATDRSKIALIGYCFGGASVLEYLRTVGGIRGVVSFHGGLELVGKEWSATSEGAKVLVLTGADDPAATAPALLELQQNLTTAAVDWEVNIYSHTKHGFTNPDSDKANRPQFAAYNAQSDRRSWTAMQRFLEEIFSY
jgi:dienelactone hydrolase